MSRVHSTSCISEQLSIGACARVCEGRKERSGNEEQSIPLEIQWKRRIEENFWGAYCRKEVKRTENGVLC